MIINTEVKFVREKYYGINKTAGTNSITKLANVTDIASEKSLEAFGEWRDDGKKVRLSAPLGYEPSYCIIDDIKYEIASYTIHRGRQSFTLKKAKSNG